MPAGYNKYANVQETMMSHKNEKIDVVLITMSLIAVLLTVLGLAMFPAEAEHAANQLFELSKRDRVRHLSYNV